ncbi:FAD-binding oxidoreductase [Streptomyces sp. B-S-A6]|uniref:FAD-binding oxidoreductase n=1 Tax=Streptomyces cavernicola TaxID=3043613 RepID=A0ABT6SGW2_9ACTN|nr:FAD-binding oxidoreductase [Streptomyces sp. B-S-A6]MDI3407447.1 FAD-binding oxidoreductase [Streptomyces sp. B-S-A6]
MDRRGTGTDRDVDRGHGPRDGRGIGRRRVITAGAALALGAGASACSAGASGDGKATATTNTATGTATSTSAASQRPTGPAWSAFAKGLDGELVRPGDADWASARQLYNTRFDALRPSAVAYPAHEDDVRTVLDFARRHKTPLSIRNGGHSYAGWSSGDGRLILDVSRLGSVRAAAGSATVGAGAKLIDVYRPLAAKGVTVPAGSCPSVGVSGLTLGGGHGVTSRAYGLTCDSLTQATVITADGRRLVCSEEGPVENTDLFWALRGAGNGNFGVVTELRFRTHPAPQGVTGYLTWPWRKAATLLKAWQEWGPDQPDEIWSSLHLAAAPGGGPTISLAVFSMGTYGELQNAVDRLADGPGGPGSASNVSLKRRSYLDAMEVYAGCSGFGDDAQCHLPGSTPGRDSAGALGRETYAARSDFYSRSLSDAGIRALLTRVERVAGGPGSVALTALGGAINRVDPTATAFVHRRQRVLAQYVGAWRAGTSGTAARAWLDGTHAAMRPYASGAAYQNYTDPALKDWRTAYYGPAAGRLKKLKGTYDPERMFTFPQAL